MIILKVGFTNIVGDLFHVGHLQFLNKCKEYCDYLIVGVRTDRSASSYKREPIIPFRERIKLIEALRIVDKVVVIDGYNVDEDVLQAIKMVILGGYYINFVFHGDDREILKGRGQAFLEGAGIKLIYFPYHHEQTTTKIIKRIIEMK